jgi:PKD repeat protein
VRRRLSLLCVAAVAAAGVSAATVAPATAAPSERGSSANAPAAVPGELLVGYVAGATASERGRARGRASAQFAERVVAAQADRTEVELVRLPQGKSREQAIAELRSDPAVAYAEPNWVYTHQTVSDPYYTSTDPANALWGMHGDLTSPPNAYGSQAGEAWAAGHTGSKEVYIGVIDEGIQYDHPDLLGQVANPNETAGNRVDDDGNGFVDDAQGWDFANNDNSVYDGGARGSLDDHGTHVAGTIGAKADGEGVVGVNHVVRMISGKFLGRNGGTLANAVKAVDYFTDLKVNRGLNVVATNNSWGGGGFSQALLEAIERADSAGILFVAAAGNSGTDNDAEASYPSGYNVPNVIAVAAIEPGGALASFSQYGATTVDLAAPGVDVWSTTAYNGHSKYSGTSMATPHVSGAVALYAAARTGDAATVKAALLDTTTPTAALVGKTVTGGRLDVASMIDPPEPTAPTASFSSSCSGLTCTFTDTSTDSPTAWSWTVDRVAVSAAPSLTHTFAKAGDYAVELTATNEFGSSAASQLISVEDVVRTVTVTAGKKKGKYTPVTVTWDGFAGSHVDMTRSGTTLPTENDEHHSENWSGSGTVTYTICETGSERCATGSTTI